jgi:hypothetical protein
MTEQTAYEAEVRRIAQLLHTTWWQHDKDGIPHFGTVCTTPEIWDQARAMVSEMAKVAQDAYQAVEQGHDMGCGSYAIERGLIPSSENASGNHE